MFDIVAPYAFANFEPNNRVHRLAHAISRIHCPMSARIIRRHSRPAVWSRRIALFCLQLLIIAVILHRSATIGSIEFTNLLSIAIAGALTALVMAAVSLAKIWRQGALGAGTATAGIFVAMLVLGVPLWHLPSLLFKPKINDIVTDPKTPPRFVALLGKRPTGANAYIYPGAAFAEWQLRDYPDIRPMMLERSREATFDLVRDAVKVLGWEVVADEPPSEMAPGRIEAVARTPVVAYADDVVIVVSRVRNESRIDVRSASRFGDHDLGANARRIRRLFANVKTGLAEGEKSALRKRKGGVKCGRPAARHHQSPFRQIFKMSQNRQSRRVGEFGLEIFINFGNNLGNEANSFLDAFEDRRLPPFAVQKVGAHHSGRSFDLSAVAWKKRQVTTDE